MREHIGLEVIEEPPTSYVVDAAIAAFNYASRGRSYVSGDRIRPLPLSVKNITDVVEAHPMFLRRGELDPCVFAIDDIFLDEYDK